MAGAGYKLFNTGDVLTAAQVNTYLNEQTVMVFADSAARTTALSGVLAEGMMSYLQDTDSVEVYDGTSWTAVGGGGLTSPLTTKGDVWGYSTTDARIPVGANGTVLTADSVETLGVKWAAPASGGGMTLLNSGNTTLSGSAFSITSISGSYKDLVLNIYGLNPSSATALATLTFNSDTATNYIHATCDFVAGVSNNTLNQENANGISLHRFGRQYLGQNTANFWRYNIYGYTRTGNRTIAETFSQDGGSTPSVGYGAINYEGSSAITSLTITLDTGTFSAGTLEVYGVN